MLYPQHLILFLLSGLIQVLLVVGGQLRFFFQQAADYFSAVGAGGVHLFGGNADQSHESAEGDVQFFIAGYSGIRGEPQGHLHTGNNIMGVEVGNVRRKFHIAFGKNQHAGINPVVAGKEKFPKQPLLNHIMVKTAQRRGRHDSLKQADKGAAEKFRLRADVHQLQQLAAEFLHFGF